MGPSLPWESSFAEQVPRDLTLRGFSLCQGDIRYYDASVTQLQPMITGNIRNQVDALWNAFWSGGIANPLEVIEKITYLLFLKRLDAPSSRNTSTITSSTASISTTP